LTETRVTTFFYDSYISPAVLRNLDVSPDGIEVARLPGFDIVIRPLANLVRSNQHSVYGIVADLTHAELDRLYSHARDALGGTYLPQAVLVHALKGRAKPALCYIAAELDDAPASVDYIECITGPARTYDFPDSYIERLELYMP
jgi:hypothetical protein